MSAQSLILASALLLLGVPATAQTGCQYTLDSPGYLMGAQGGTLRFDVSTAAGCTWQVFNQTPWVTVVSGGSGSGPGTVTLSVAANPGTEARIAAVGVQTEGFFVVQEGATPGCAFGIAPTSATVPAAGGDVTVAVTTASTCSWSAGSNKVWISVVSPVPGRGNGSLMYRVLANTGTAPRSAVVTVAGQPHTVTQAGSSQSRQERGKFTMRESLRPS